MFLVQLSFVKLLILSPSVVVVVVVLVVSSIIIEVIDHLGNPAVDGTIRID
jgi:hypothetical protein